LLGEVTTLAQRLLIVCIGLAFATSIAAASMFHMPVTNHSPHEAPKRSPHAAEKRNPHQAMKHAKPQKPPKHAVAMHQKPPKVAKH
jgi:hypothetical protein